MTTATEHGPNERTLDNKLRDAYAANNDLLRRLSAAEKLIKGLVDNDKCHYDHDDYCQTHYRPKPCPNELAIAFLLLQKPALTQEPEPS